MDSPTFLLFRCLPKSGELGNAALGSGSKVGGKAEGMAEPEAVTSHPSSRERLQLLPGLGSHWEVISGSYLWL